ncbi:hypothetical protein AHAS_Ahas18G0066800 [Arachis hypogaea]
MIQEDCCMELRPSSSTLANSLNPSSMKHPMPVFRSPWTTLVIPRIESDLSPICMRLYYPWTAFADALKKILLECCDSPNPLHPRCFLACVEALGDHLHSPSFLPFLAPHYSQLYSYALLMDDSVSQCWFE